MTLQFDEADQRLRSLCRDFDRKTADVAELRGMEIPVILKESLCSALDANASAILASDQAAYSRSARSIFINNRTFWSLPEHQRLAALAHEVGHAVSHRENLESRQLFRMMSDCQIADLLACRWGFFEALLEERTTYYGRRYAEALALWPDEAAFASAMVRWRQRRIAGLQ